MHKTSAWPLSQVFGALILYASLYPFSGWHNQGVAPWEFLFSPLPKYWTAFDVVSNVLGYAPLGFLLALSVLRRGSPRSAPTGNGTAVAVATLAAGLLSLSMEGLQNYLPSRVASNLDLVLNVLGALCGAVVAACLELVGAIDHWSRFRARWFVEDARGALVLLALWPVAQLFPASVPLGLGQVLERLEAALAEWLVDTPFLDWLPVREVELQPLVPGVEMICVALGGLIPCLLGYTVTRLTAQRVFFAAFALLAGVGVTALSAALSWGPVHAWAWLSLPVRAGLGLGLAMALVLLAVPRRGCAALVLLALVLHLSLLNQAPASPYFAQTLQTWEQGRFIRFNGVVQWLGWLWPYAALAYVLVRVSRASSPSRMGE